MLIFACHELLAGDRQLAMRLLDLLGTHDPGLRYDYASIETDASDGYPNRFITIDQLREAASKLVAGDPRGKALLEEPASQLKLRLKRYGPARIPGADRARGQGPLTTAPIPVTANRYLVGSKSRPSAA